MTPSPEYRPADHVVFTDLDGVEAVLVDLNTKQYFTLNETARLVWRAVADGRGMDAVVASLTDTYAVSEEHARRSSTAIVAEFLRLGLMRQA